MLVKKIFLLFILLVCVAGCAVDDNPPQILQEIEQGLYKI
jgi:outer membrane lipoprotein-sorting protein